MICMYVCMYVWTSVIFDVVLKEVRVRSGKTGKKLRGRTEEYN
jgi:hypothetical protein